MTDSKVLWKFIRIRWIRYVIFRHALGFGLIMGIGIPLMNTILPSPNYDLAIRLQFSVPFFVISWGCYGAYS